KMDNLNGDLTKLKNSLNAAMIEAGQGAQGPLRSLTEGATAAVNAFAGMPAPIRNAMEVVGLATGGVLLAVAGFVTLSVKIGETVKAFQELGVASKLASFASPMGIAFGVAALAIGGFVKSQMDAAAASEELRQTLDQTTGAITGQTTATVALRIQQALGKSWTDEASGSTQTLAESYAHLGISLGTMTQYALGNAEAVDRVNSAQAANEAVITSLTAKHGALTDAEYAQLVAAEQQSAMWGNLKKTLGDTTAGLGAQIDGQKAVGAAMGEVTGKTEGMAAAQKVNAEQMKKEGEQAKATAAENKGLLDSISALANLTLGARGAERAFAAAVDEAQKALDKNGKTLDVNTEAGRANAAAIDKIAASALKNVEETFKNRGATESLTEAVAKAEQQVDAGRAAFVKQATQMGMSKDAANALADQLGLTRDNVDRLSQTIEGVPRTINSKIVVETAPANAAVDGARRKLDAMQDYTVTARIMVTANFDAAAVAAMQLGSQRKTVAMTAAGFASGGYTGDGGLNDVAGVVHSREFVITAEATSRLGRGYLEGLNSGRFDSRSAGAVPAAPGKAGPMELTGTLDLGNGLTGLVRGVVREANSEQAREVRYGAR
ncbi:MAG: hypothetical protein M3067_10855, partial [Chloroflexota bacterium]|nr:hypothetical protein [Chloroflexota bacterium]